MKYIDTEKLIAEIERQQRRLILLSNTEQVDMRRDCALQNGVYNSILATISSLQQEQPEVDLEKEIQEYWYLHQYDHRLKKQVIDGHGKAVLENTARHFYELGLKARKEE